MGFNFGQLDCPYPAVRFPAYGQRGMVATSNQFAAQAGLEILKQGGNAVDAAVATAACLTVTEPTANGLGGDAFAIVSFQGEMYGLNASGPAPNSLSLSKLVKAGYKEIPKYGFVPVTVPGQPAGWAALIKRFGKLTLPEVLAPAIEYAKGGYPVSAVLSRGWSRACEIYKKNLKGEEFAPWFATFAPEGRAPVPGEIVRLPEHGETLRLIGETNGESFYRGELAEKIAAFSRKYNGYLQAEDLASYQAEWVDPISTNYRGYDVWELPPNGQGIATLLALNILEGYDFAQNQPLDIYHKQIEAMKLAFEIVTRHVTDSRNLKINITDLLSKEWAAEQRKRIGTKAFQPLPSQEQPGGTVYLAAADAEGNSVSFIQSNYMGFGSGLVVPGTGIALHNRGHNFSVDPTHDNCLEPGKRPYHTIIPGFLSQNGTALGPFGVMGGFMQPQGHVQVVMNLVDFKHNPQEAIAAPRWQWKQGKVVELESTLPTDVCAGLKQLGHEITVTESSLGYGRGQIILRMPNGAYVGGTETRVDGTVAVW